ncbi:COG4223 family protein [Paracoccus marinaquae]|uniref:Inner membrane protein n=1 Tax=Paracoccus marinaquae TaxID=2841926 RepID=A0ABS6ADC0_9RHOB|nr:hypothetical protein [Paracoccus marinaquae]MBU3028598.1 hypothetical protein [Paracoccus marinaquae]
MASGGEIRPVESTLLGEGKQGRPAAAAKPAATTAAADDKPADRKVVEDKVAEDAARKAVPDDRPAGAAPVAVSQGSSTVPQVAPPAQQVTVQKTGFWPVVLGGVVAAGLGAAATIWALPQLPAGWLPAAPGAEVDAGALRAEAVAAAESAARQQIDALRTELPLSGVDATAIQADAVSAAETAARQQVEALRSELAEASPQAVAPAGDGGALAQQVAALQALIDQQTARIEELAARPVLDPGAAQKLQTLADQAGALEQQIAATAEQAQSSISAAQAEAQKLQEAAEDSTRRAEAVAAIASLQAALDRGVTPDEARQTLEGAGLETPDALTRDVPSLEALQAGFAEASRAALRVSLSEDSAGGGNALTNFLKAQTGARSVTPQEGDDTDAILSRANAEIAAGNVGAALDQMTALPETARNAPAMAAWLAGATAYRDAQAALSDLSASSN